MRAIDIITTDYTERKVQHIDVPEWQVQNEGAGPDDPKTKPLRVYWNLLTIEERKKYSGSSGGDVDWFFMMARDEKGERIFTLEDKPKLKMHADAAIITRIVAKMVGINRLTAADVEEAEKN